MFQSRQSHLIDAVVILLDMQPPIWVRWVLRAYKRVLERGIGQ